MLDRAEKLLLETMSIEVKCFRSAYGDIYLCLRLLDYRGAEKMDKMQVVLTLENWVFFKKCTEFKGFFLHSDNPFSLELATGKPQKFHSCQNRSGVGNLFVFDVKHCTDRFFSLFSPMLNVKHL